MNQKAVVESREYHLLETVPSLTGQDQFVLCEDGDGNQFVCPEELWLRHAPQAEAVAIKKKVKRIGTRGLSGAGQTDDLKSSICGQNRILSGSAERCQTAGSIQKSKIL